MSVLAASTGCRTTEIPDGSLYNEILIGMISDLPALPSFPELQWVLEANDRYSIPEEDTNRFLDYRDKELPRYRFEIEKYQRELNIIINQYVRQSMSSSDSNSMLNSIEGAISIMKLTVSSDLTKSIISEIMPGSFHMKRF